MNELSYLYKKQGIVNLKEELLEIFEEENENFEELFLKARFARKWDYRQNSLYAITDDYNELIEFASAFTYFPSYGYQKFYGQILLNDGSWLEVNNEDGKEYWERIKRPKF
jgi:hypothetical protein